MKSKKTLKLMPTNSNILNACKNISKNINVDRDSIYYLFDLDDKASSTNLTFNVQANVSLTFYILSVNNASSNDFKFHSNKQYKSKVSMYAKCFVSKNAKISLNCDIVVNKNTKEVIAEQEINGFVFSD